MLKPMDIKKVLELRARGESIRSIATGIGCSKTTIVELLKKCDKHGIGLDQLQEEQYADLMALLYPRERVYETQKNEPDWEQVHEKLATRKRVNLKYLWEDYKREHPDGFEYSQYCYRYSQWRGVKKDLSMVQEHIPGMRVCVDWAGLAPEIVQVNVKAVKAYFFFGVLSYSYYPYVIAFPDRSQRNWSIAHIKMFNWFGGVPKLITPDNCKTAVKYSSRWDPEINSAYQELGDYYDVGIVPARVRKPKDKSAVEGSIGYFETWIIEAVTDMANRNGLFESFDELNLEVMRLLMELVKKDFQQRPGSRESVFLEVEKPALLPLPVQPFDNLSFTEWRVDHTYHYYHKDSATYYSVPYTLYGKIVTIRAGYRSLTVFDRQGIPVSTQSINYDRNKRYVTNPDHMPTHHQEQLKANHMDGSAYRIKARKVGLATAEFIDQLLKSVPHEQTMYRACQGVLSMAGKVTIGPERLEKACDRLVKMGSISYKSLKSMLERNLEGVYVTDTGAATPVHENLRDQSEFV